MQAFAYQSGQLFAEGVAVQELARRYGTPLYVYSRNHLRQQYRALSAAMADVQPLVCYSVKANSNAAVIRTLVDEGAGLDIVSGGELYRALRAGADAAKIVFAGVGKTREEIEYALREQILFFTVESEPEARRISECAGQLGVKARVAFRINPDVDPKTHKYISTGKKENKFGLDLERTLKAYELVAALPNVEIVGLHMHIGSQILAVQPFAAALEKVREVCVELKRAHRTFRYLDIGGGLGIDYKPDQQPLDFQAFAGAVLPLLRALDLQVVMEPGRSIVGNAGILLCRVQYVKENYFKRFIVVDAAMNDLIRPSLYQAHHEVLPVIATGHRVQGDLVGPICESGDFLAADRDLPDVREGDLLAVMSAGAYGFAMSSNYNSRGRAAEVMVDGAMSVQVRRRETWEDLVRGEIEGAFPVERTMFEGAYTALVTPFNRDGSVDYGKLRALIEMQIAAGVDGIVPVGTTGESPTLDFAEHERVIDVSVEACRQRLKVIAGTGANATAEALRLTQYALDAGADATLQVTPYYNKPNQEGLIRHFTAVADLGLPVVLYNIPGRTAREIEVATVEKLSRHPAIVALKEAGGSVDRVSQILRVCNLTILSGDDVLTLPMMEAGAKGVISVASNLAPAPVVAMVRAALAGRWDEARQLHTRYHRLFTDLFLDTNPIPIKAAMAMAGLIEEVYRLPLCEMNPALRQKLAEGLREMGLIKGSS